MTKSQLILGVFACIVIAFALPGNASAAAGKDKTPRIANYFLKWHLSDAEVDELARWDVVILDPETQVNTRPQLERLRAKQPRPVMLAYITSQEIRKDAGQLTEAPLRRKLAAAIPDAWYLTDTKSNRTSWWPGAFLLNVTDAAPPVGGERWNTFLPRFLSENVLSSGLWDGVFLDNAWGYISWIPFSKDFDLDRDGVGDSREELDRAWKNGMEHMVAEIRRLTPGKSVFGNSIKFGPNLVRVLDGAMLENFPDPSWGAFLESYQRHETLGRPGFALIVNGGTANRGAQADYRKMRFTLGSTLLGSAATSFDFGDQAHEQLWYYDEYDAPIGSPTGPPNNLREFRQTGRRDPSVWRRDFTRGVALVNSTDAPVSTHFDDPLDHLVGAQDRTVNSGAPATDVTLPAHDGVVLLKPIADLVGAVFRVGSFARVFDGNGFTKRRGFFPSAPTTEGGTLRWVGDLDGDGRADTIRADPTAVTITYGNGARRVLLPYGSRYTGGVTFAIGDLNGDGRAEIVTGALRGGAQVQVFDASGRHVGGFFALSNFHGTGVRVAAADLDGRGRSQIIATRAQVPSEIRVFTAAGTFVRSWNALSVPAVAGGYTLAAGDLEGNGSAEVLVGTGARAVPQLAIYSGQGGFIRQFAPLAVTNQSGFLIGVADVDGDGKKEILVMAEHLQ